ncbi:hypothetical protein BH10BAC1_BH10BAC1_06980 [soil metagenome]
MKKIIFMLSFATIVAIVFTGCGNTTTDSTKNQTAKETYACPMHPEVTSDKAGTCPKCGMDLEKVETVVTKDSTSHK